MSAPYVMTNGRHKGKSIEHIPVGYLKWMVNEHHTQADYAKGELERRGTVFPNLDISGHALDRASLCCKWEYRQTRKENEGLHAWLVRMSEAALERGTPRPGHVGQFAFQGMSFRFTTEHEWPVLKTVLPIGKRRREKKMVKSQLGNASSRTCEELRGVVPPPDYAAAEMPPSVTHLIHGANTGPTIWALRLQVKRDVENAVDQQKLVPYGVVLAYAEQVGQEAVAYLHMRLERQAAHLIAARILCVVFALACVALVSL